MLYYPHYGAGDRIVYQGVVTGLRISSVATVALLDNLPSAVTDLVAAAASSYSIQVCHGGMILSGVLASVGDGEDLDSELVTNGTFDANITGWTNRADKQWDTCDWDGVGQLRLIGNGDGDPNAYYAYSGDNVAIVAGALYKRTADVTIVSGGPITMSLKQATTSGTVYGTSTQAVTGAISAYRTGDVTENVTVQFYQPTGLAASVLVDNVSVKKVIGPSTSGCVIESAAGAGDGTFTVNQWGTTSGQYNKAGYMIVVRKL